MSKRLNISLSDEMITWITEQAKNNGLPVASMAVLLIHEAKSHRDMLSASRQAFDWLSGLTPDQKNFFISNMVNSEDEKRSK